MNEKKPYSKPFKLDEIRKEKVYSVPDDYFEKLPTIIQTRAVESTKQKNWLAGVGVLRLALPALVIILVAGYFGYKYQFGKVTEDARIEAMLADVSTEELVNYLGQTDITSDELLEMVSFEGESLEDFSSPGLDEVSDEDLELLIDDIDFGNENSI